MNVIYLFKTFFQNSFYFLSLKYDDAFFFFSTGTGLERMGVVGLDQDYWRMPDRLGCSRIAAMLICGL